MTQFNIEEILGSFKAMNAENVLAEHVNQSQKIDAEIDKLQQLKSKSKEVIISIMQSMNVDNHETLDFDVCVYNRIGQKYNKAKCFDDLLKKNKIPSHYINKHTNKTISLTKCLKITKK